MQDTYCFHTALQSSACLIRLNFAKRWLLLCNLQFPISEWLSDMGIIIFFSRVVESFSHWTGFDNCF